MKNKYIKGTHISECKFRELLKLFREDISALTASRLLGLSVKTIQRIYTLLRERILSLAAKDNQPLLAKLKLMKAILEQKE